MSAFLGILGPKLLIKQLKMPFYPFFFPTKSSPTSILRSEMFGIENLFILQKIFALNLSATHVSPCSWNVSYFNKAFVGLGSCDNVQTERKIFEYANWPRPQIKRAGPSSWCPSSWSLQLVCPAGSSSWFVQLVRPAGSSSWFVQLV